MSNNDLTTTTTVQLILGKESQLEAIKSQIARLKAQEVVLSSEIEACKHKITQYMIANNIKKVETTDHHITLRQPKTTSVCVTNLELVPKELIRTKIVREADKVLIKRRFETGEHVDGCELVPTAPSVQITEK